MIAPRAARFLTADEYRCLGPNPNELAERSNDSRSELDVSSSGADIDVFRFGPATHGP